ncbi:MAG: hypothetical protein M9941_16905 [Anaerolineae bacterium]|nr:hypothetical protein [Anaerolineae bacterium]MCO5199426.1 hypothetical protein [Anaerolineae bacterium]
MIRQQRLLNWRRSGAFGIIALLALAVLAACSVETSPAQVGSATGAIDSAESVAIQALDPDDPNRAYTSANVNEIGTAGDIQFINSFATW